MQPQEQPVVKIGQLEILEMRADAKKALGPKFDLRAFHDRLLSHGTVPMSAARRDMREWVDAQKTNAGG